MANHIFKRFGETTILLKRFHINFKILPQTMAGPSEFAAETAYAKAERVIWFEHAMANFGKMYTIEDFRKTGRYLIRESSDTASVSIRDNLSEESGFPSHASFTTHMGTPLILYIFSTAGGTDHPTHITIHENNYTFEWKHPHERSDGGPAMLSLVDDTHWGINYPHYRLHGPAFIGKGDNPVSEYQIEGMPDPVRSENDPLLLAAREKYYADHPLSRPGRRIKHAPV